MHKEDGRSRNFCFIGFKTEQSAKEAVKYFNQTFNLCNQQLKCKIIQNHFN